MGSNACSNFLEYLSERLGISKVVHFLIFIGCFVIKKFQELSNFRHFNTRIRVLSCLRLIFTFGVSELSSISDKSRSVLTIKFI
jgi:hypothetical protein